MDLHHRRDTESGDIGSDPWKAYPLLKAAELDSRVLAEGEEHQLGIMKLGQYF